MRRTGVAGAPVAAVALLAMAVAGPAAAKETKMDEARFGKTVRVYVGRFRLEVPADSKRTGGEASLRHLELREVAMPGKPDEAFHATFGVKLAEIAAIKARRMRPSWVDGEIRAQVELAPGPDRFAAVLYHTANTKRVVACAALRQKGTAGLWLEHTAVDLAEKDAQLKIVGTVGRAWQPLADGAPRPTGDVFHLPTGAVALPFEDDESVSATWVGGPLGVEVKLSTETTDEPRGGGLMARFGEAVARAGAAVTAGASVVRNGGRKAAGLGGEEFVMRDSEDGKLYFLWEFKGEKDSGAKPEIQLQMITKDERQKEKMAFWDALVDSLRPASAP